MATWEIGNTLQAGLKVKNSSGALADLGGGDPTCTVTLPDATTTAATVTKTATGTYTATLTATQAGRHLLTWEGSGDNSGGLPYTDVLDVLPTNPRFIISLADARAALNLLAASTVDDDEVRLYLAAATEVIEARAGRVLVASVTKTLSGDGRYGLPLPVIPTAITTVTEDGVILTASTQYVYDESGVLWRGSQKGSATWSSNSPRNVVVTYTVGTSIVPPSIILAAREAVRVQFQRSQLALRPVFGDDGALAQPMPVGWGTVDELIRAAQSEAGGLPSPRLPGIA